jgi:hypothetical protein
MRRLRIAALLIVPLCAAGAATAAPAEVVADSDGDGLFDFDEVRKYRTDPKKADSDGDGTPDGAGEERREFTYSIRCVVEHLPPAAAISDAHQDAREMKRTDEAVTLEIVAYPLADPQADSPDAREVGTPAAARFSEFTRPNLTCDFDAAMTKDLVAALRKDGIDPTALGDRSLVERVSRWAFDRSRTVRMGFCSFCVTAKGGRLAVEPGLEAYMRKACDTEPKSDEGHVPLPKKRTLEQQLDAEVRGRSMFEDRVHGSCTSSAIYLQTVLRALGVPTRTTVAMPPADGNDPAQTKRLAEGLRPSAIRDAVLAGPQGGWTEHTFNVVRVGGRWRRLNYTALDPSIVDRTYLGLMLRILDYDDIARSGVSATWGRKWALGESSARFPTGNPYRLLEVSDLVGPHSNVALPPAKPKEEPPKERTTLTITAAAWMPAADVAKMRVEGPDLLELSLAEAVPGESYEPYTRFAQGADVRFVLRASGHPDVPATYTWATMDRGGGMRVVLGVDRSTLAPGVAYGLVPRNETGTNRWAVAEGLTVAR